MVDGAARRHGAAIGPPSAWEGLPEALLASILGLATATSSDASGSSSVSAAAAARLTCSSWRRGVDSNLARLAPRAWPCAARGGPVLSSFAQVQAVDLASLRWGDTQPQARQERPMAESCSPEPAAGAPAAGGASGAAGAQHAAPGGSSGGSGSSATALDLMGAAVLRPKAQDEADAVACVRASPAAPAGAPSALTCYVASRWPEAVPHVTPVATLRLWRELPGLRALRSLRLAGSLLLVRSVHTAVDACPDAASGLALLQQCSGDGLSSPVIRHTYSLQLPAAALAQLTALTSLAIEWQLRVAQPDEEGDAPSACAGGGQLPPRRRSYEGGSAPSLCVQHVADPRVALPQSFAALAQLQQLELAGAVVGPDALLPLAGLQQLTGLALGPGHLDTSALLPLVRSGVVARLRTLVLRQAGAWDARGAAAVLRAATHLHALEVQELEMPSSTAALRAAVIPAAERLTAADLAPLGAHLTRLAWSTCAQRLASGASLLCPASTMAGTVPAAAAAAAAAAGGGGAGGLAAGDVTPAAAAPWLASLASLVCLRISGVQRDGSVFGAPVLEAVSNSIGSCSRLEQLEVHGLGVPLLPPALAGLPRLRSVSIASSAVARRAAFGADAALAVLGACHGLASLTLAGCELRHVPAWLAGLAGLTQLQLHCNYIQELPAGGSLGLPPGLRSLRLSDNRLREVPHSIGQLSCLTALQLDANYLTSLPASVWQLPALAELSARENMLPDLPELLAPAAAAGSSAAAAAAVACDDGPAAAAAAAHGGRDDAAAARQASLSAEDEEMLGGIGVLRQLPHARSGGAGGGAAASTDGAWQQPQQPQQQCCRCAGSLKVLLLTDNQLSQLPSSIGQLTSLQRLDLGRNQLRVLPDSCGLWTCSRLEDLQLADNHLRRLPAGLARLQRLTELDVSGNHLACCSAGSAGGGGGQRQTASVPAPAAACPGCAPGSAAAAPGAGASAAAAGATRGPDSAPAAAHAAGSQPLPTPLGCLPQLQRLRMGRQHVDAAGSSWSGAQYPLQLLLAGLGELVERIRGLAPPGHQCPVAKAAAAAVAHLTAGRRSRAELDRQLLERMQTEPGWVFVPAPGAAGKASVAAAVAPAAAALGAAGAAP